MIHRSKSWLTRLFAKIVATPSRSKSRKRSRARFSLESLEQRITPAGPSYGFALGAVDASPSFIDSSSGYAVTADSAGNVYVTGQFTGTQTFGSNPSAGNQTLSARGFNNGDAFVAEYNVTGALQWVVDLGGSGATAKGTGIAVDSSGNVDVTGSFSGTISLDPASSISLTSAGPGTNAFVAQLNSSGQANWGFVLGADATNNPGDKTVGTAIAVDSSNNVYTTGYFKGTGNFDNGTGNHNLTSSSAGADTNAYAAKIDASGNFVWAIHLGTAVSADAGAVTAEGNGIAVDGSGNVYTTGFFVGTDSFSQFGSGDQLTSSTAGADTNAYVTKLNTDGITLWVAPLGAGSGASAKATGTGIAVDGSGNVYTTGFFQGTGDFTGVSGNPQFLPSSTNGTDTNAYVSKLNSSGNGIWARALGTGSGAGTITSEGMGIALDPLGFVYTTGYFKGTDSFSGTGSGDTLTSSSSGADTNAYVSKLTTAGGYVFSLALGASTNGSSAFASGQGIAVDGFGNVDDTGYFKGVGSFSGIGTGDSLSSSDNGADNSFYLSQQTQLALSPLTLPSGIDGRSYNGGSGVTLSASGGTPAYTYALVSGTTLPPGLTLNASTGTITGTPTATGAYTFTIGVTDSVGLTGFRTYTITITPGLDNSVGYAVATDSAGNTYLTGYFQGTKNFGGTSLTANGTQDAFAAEYNSAGALVWVDQFGSNASNAEGNTVTGTGIAVDASGFVYVTGYFQGTANFNGTDTSDPLSSISSANGSNAFVVKLNATANGAFVWADKLGSGSANAQGAGIAVDGAGNVYTTGSFLGTGNFSGSGAIDNLTSSNAGNDPNAYVSKLNSTGAYVWAANVGVGATAYGTGIAVDGSGNVDTTGYFSGTGNFAGKTGTDNLTSSGGNNAYVSKLNSSGAYVWADDLGAGASAYGKAIALDSLGNIYTTGYFLGNGSFSGTGSGSSLTSSSTVNGTNAYVSKLFANGQYAWGTALGAGSTNAEGLGIAVDGLGNVDTVGYFTGSGSFSGTGSGDIPLGDGTPSSANNAYLSGLNTNGKYRFAVDLGYGSIGAVGTGVSVNTLGYVDTVGYFTGTGNFPTSSTANPLTSSNGGANVSLYLTQTQPLAFTPPTLPNGIQNQTYTVPLTSSGGGSTTYIYSIVSGALPTGVSLNPSTGVISGTPVSAGVYHFVIGASDSYGANGTQSYTLTVDPGFALAGTGTGSTTSKGNAVTADAAGNAYVTGTFTGTQDFGGTSLTAKGNTDSFVAKYDSRGTLQWVKDLGGSGAAVVTGGIAVDAAGNVDTTGAFSGTADFDGTGTTDALVSTGINAFVSQLTSTGAYSFVKQLGAGSTTFGSGIAVDSSGNIYTTGSFAGTGGFSGSNSTSTDSLTSVSGSNAYVSKLTNAGAFGFIAQLGAGTLNTQGIGIAVDSGGNVYTTGSFTGTGGFSGSSSTSTDSLTSVGGGSNAYVSKLTGAGAFGLIAQLGAGTSNTGGTGIAVDSGGNVYTTGSFTGTGGFSGSSSTSADPLTSIGNNNANNTNNVYVSKLTGTGAFGFIDELGAGSIQTTSAGLALDGVGNVYTTGYFQGSGNFSGTGTSTPLTSTGSGVNAYVSKLSTTGAYITDLSLGGNSSGTFGYGITVSNLGTIYTVGYFTGTGNFDGGAGTHNLTSSNGGANNSFFLDQIQQTSGFVIADFAGSGLYEYNPNEGFQQLSPYDPTSFVSNVLGEIVAVFGSGLYEYVAGTWSQIDNLVPTSYKLSDGGNVVADFQGSGLYEYTPGAGWVRLSPYDPTSYAVDAAGDVTAQYSSGLYQYVVGTGFIQLSPYVPTSYAIDAAGDVVADFRGAGLYEYTAQTGWTNLTPYDPTTYTVGSSGDIAVFIAGAGLYEYVPGTGFRNLAETTAPSSLAVDAQGDVVAYVSGTGLEEYNAATMTWTVLTTLNPTKYAVDSVGNVAADFTGSGLYEHTIGGWAHLSPFDSAKFFIVG